MKVHTNYKFATLPFLTKYDIMHLIPSGFSLRLGLTKAIDNKCINNLPLGYCRSQSRSETHSDLTFYLRDSNEDVVDRQLH